MPFAIVVAAAVILFQLFGLEVSRLLRTSYGPFQLLDLPRDATNVAKDETGHYNRALWSERTGQRFILYA